MINPYTQVITSYTNYTAQSSPGSLLLSVADIPSLPIGRTVLWNGMPVIFTNSGGSLPVGINPNTIYYMSGVNQASVNTFFVSQTFSQSIQVTERILSGGNLQSPSVCIPFSNAGTGTNTFYLSVQGTYTGEYDHSQLIGELATHHHSITTEQGSGGVIARTGGTSPLSVNTGDTGNQSPFNIVQPYTLMNFFIKL